MTAEATIGYMSLDNAATNLETTPLAVKRLIARERLAAVQLGVGGRWRVAAAELTRYIGNGAPDLRMPQTPHNWFDPDDTSRAADVFEHSFIQAAEWSLGDTPPAGDGPFEVEITPAMRATMTLDTPKPMLRRKEQAPVFVNVFHAWTVHRLRAIAKRMVSSAGETNMLAKLYDSPAAYATIKADSMLALAKSNITFRKTFPLAAMMKTVQFFVPVINLLGTLSRDQAWQAAF